MQGLNFNEACLHFLESQNLVAVRTNEFLEPEVAVRASRTTLVWACSLRSPSTLLAMPASELSHKLDLLLQLIREGWTSKFELIMEPLTPDSAREVSILMISRSSTYFLALIRLRSLFEKGCKLVYHGRPQSYYECLLAFDDLSDFHDDPRRLMWNQRQFLDLLHGRPVIDSAPDPICDFEADADAEVEPLPLEDIGGGVDALPPPALPALRRVDALAPVLAGADALGEALRPIELVVGEHAYSVRFDYFSHSSRIQRGYIHCPCHRACFRYRQVTHFRDRKALCAYLIAWCELGVTGDITREAHQAKDIIVPDDRQQAIVSML